MTIFAYLDMIKEKAHDAHLDGIIRNIMQCTETIQSHIEFTRTYEGLGLHEPQWQILAGCIHEVQLPESVGLILDIPDISLYADPMLPKVFLNLLDNSVRHGGSVTSIHISAEISGEDLFITIADDGVGIPSENKEKIFERGFGKNTGLGLFLVREIPP
jgi:signal transduction histidine kinase